MTNEKPSAYEPFAVRITSDKNRLLDTREWYERHKNDYCQHDQAPPFAWSGYFRWLLEQLEHREAQSVARTPEPTP